MAQVAVSALKARGADAPGACLAASEENFAFLITFVALRSMCSDISKLGMGCKHEVPSRWQVCHGLNMDYNLRFVVGSRKLLEAASAVGQWKRAN